jgi:hypothetical protein
MLPWKDAPVMHSSDNRVHGRIGKCTVKAVIVPAGIFFPHARQAIQASVPSPSARKMFVTPPASCSYSSVSGVAVSRRG